MSREVKHVSFGKKDIELIEFLEDKGQFSLYVKRLIKEEMERQRKAENPDPIVVSPSIEEKIDEMLELLKSGKLIMSESNEAPDVDDIGDELEATDKQKEIMNGLMGHFHVSKK